MRRVLITGGAGCLGSALAEQQLSRGATVTCIDNFETGRKEWLPQPQERFTFREGSIADKSFVDEVVAESTPTHIIHAAASYADPDAWVHDLQVNALGTVHIAQAARRLELERLIYLQTVLCYGTPEHLPITVKHPVAPFSSYAISKTAGEQYLLQADLPVVSLRIANVTGPRLTIGPIPAFYNRLSQEKPCHCSDAVRDFLDLEDFLSLIERIMDGVGGNGVYNVASGEGHSIREVYDQVQRYLGVQRHAETVPVGDDDVKEVLLDASETCAEFDWRPRVAFEASVEGALRWYDEHGPQKSVSHLRPVAEKRSSV